MVKRAIKMPILEVRGLCKQYPMTNDTESQTKQTLLHQLDLSLETGQVVMILGPSGSGKSSLLNLLAGLDSPDHGSIQLMGTELTALPERERTAFRRQHIGVIYQFFNLIPTLTVLENVLLPLTLNGRNKGQHLAELQLEHLGVADKAHRFPEQLSGGEQQRVAIARALVHEPALLLADEPTGSLDNDTAETVLQLMLSKVREQKQTLIMVTHSEQLATCADRIFRLHRGELEAVAG